MPEPIETIAAVEPVTEVKKAPPTAAPFIVHTVDKDGKPVVRGRHQYRADLIPVGSEVQAKLFVDGVVWDESGIWVAVALDGRNPLAQMRLVVDDNCALDTLEPVEAEAE